MLHESYRTLRGSFAARRVLGLTALVDFAAVIGYWVWLGRADEIQFISSQFNATSLANFVRHQYFEVACLALLRIFFVLGFYVIFKKTSRIPVFVISTLVTFLHGAELLWVLVWLHHYSILKLVYIGMSIGMSWVYVLALVLSRRVDKHMMRHSILATLESNLQTPVQKKLPPVDENSPLLVSITRSALFKPSTVEETRSKKFSEKKQTRNILDDATPALVINSERRVLPSFPRLVALLLDPKTGIKLTTQKLRLRTYKRCFSGKSLVDWLVQRMPAMATSRMQGSFFAQELLYQGYIDHVSGDMRFMDDAQYLYIFSKDITNEKLPVHSLNPEVNRDLEADEIEDYFDRRTSNDQNQFVDRTSSSLSYYDTPGFNYDTLYPVAKSAPSLGFVHPATPQANPQQISASSSGVANIVVEAKDGVSVNIEVRRSISESAVPREAPPMPSAPPLEKDKPSEPDGLPDSKRKISPLFQNFMDQMRHPVTGLSIKDRKQHLSATQFTTYHRCFVGREAVDFIMKTMALESREHAVKIGQKMLEVGVIHHVVDRLPFLDSEDFYRFRVDD